jgi:hypothetical protein
MESAALAHGANANVTRSIKPVRASRRCVERRETMVESQDWVEEFFIGILS